MTKRPAAMHSRNRAGSPTWSYWRRRGRHSLPRLTACWEAIHRGLEEIGIDTVIDKDIQGHLVVTVKAPEDERFDFSKLHDYCYERGFTIYPGKMFGLATFRLCNLGWITARDIENFFVVAKEAFQEMGYELPIK